MNEPKVYILVAHRFSWKRERARNILKRMAKQGLIKFKGISRDCFIYHTNIKENYDEFFKRIKQ